MANDYVANLLPRLYVGAQDVLREELPLLARVSREDNWGLNAAMAVQKGQTAVINRPVPFGDPTDFTPSMTPPTPANMSLTSTTVTVDQHKKVEFGVTQQEAVLYHEKNVIPNQFQEAMRSITNQMAEYLFSFYTAISGQYGTAGTGAFASNVNGLASVYEILNRQRCPKDGRFCGISFADETAAKILADLKQAERLGDAGVIRGAMLGHIQGFDLFSDPFIPLHTSTYSLGGGVVTATADTAIGAESINVTVTGGTGLILAAGDPFTFSGNTAAPNQYTSTTAVSIGVGTGVITLNKPLETAVAAAETLAEVTGNGTGKMNIAGNIRGFGMAFRTLPTVIEGGKTIGDHFGGVDDVSGAAITISNIPGDGMTMFRVSTAYGGGVVQPNYLARFATATT